MSRIRTAFSTLNGIVSSAIESPRSTIDALKLVPSIVQGLQFGAMGRFASPPDYVEGAAGEVNPLRAYFDAHTEGPGIWKAHHYFDIYHRHFRKFIGKEVRVLEVGIYSGGSLGMWLEYFGKNCHVYGMDIEKACMSYKSDRIDVFIGDQSDRSFWKRFRHEVPKVDILIDDGGHDPEQQRITLEEMLPHLQPGGVYLCEDIGAKANAFGGYVAGLACRMNAAKATSTDFGAPVIPSEFQASVRSVIQYPYVTVIEKHEHNHGMFITSKRGTEWQPY